MNASRNSIAAAVIALGLVAAGYVVIPSAGNAGVTTMSAAERVDAAFAAIEVVKEPTVRQSVRTVTIGYQTHAADVHLIRLPGLQVATR